jgi:hypothetical protein
MNGDARVFRGPLNLNLGDAGLFQSVANVVTNHHIFIEFRGEAFFIVPVRIPRLDDA